MTGSRSLLCRAAGIVTAVAAVTAAAGCAASTGSSPTTPATAGSTASSAAASQSSQAAASQSPASQTAAPSPAASSGGAASSAAASASASGDAGGSGCATRDLSVKAGTSEGAAGSVYQVLEFTNISNAACTLFGYPGVSLAAGTPVTQVGAAAARSTTATATVVTLQPGQTASTLLRITQALNYPPKKCLPTATTYLQIYPPNQTTPAYLAYKSTGCKSTSVPPLLTIGVMRSGTAG